ncbi:hypothetical protein CVT24_007600 [Panaeolus cyanescens]|uniref:Uncharacterized protein n=1 Tax=Panaeolus cyanescens TaxID=181874 RepID=A0A409YKF3_9AGAR|nr:hypothetical protein CVT24_007600 [Panaeolus cyanescens]
MSVSGLDPQLTDAELDVLSDSKQKLISAITSGVMNRNLDAQIQCLEEDGHIVILATAFNHNNPSERHEAIMAMHGNDAWIWQFLIDYSTSMLPDELYERYSQFVPNTQGPPATSGSSISAPTSITQPIPPASTSVTQPIPPASTSVTQTVPPASTSGTQTVPPASTSITQEANPSGAPASNISSVPNRADSILAPSPVIIGASTRLTPVGSDGSDIRAPPQPLSTNLSTHPVNRARANAATSAPRQTVHQTRAQELEVNEPIAVDDDEDDIQQIENPQVSQTGNTSASTTADERRAMRSGLYFWPFCTECTTRGNLCEVRQPRGKSVKCVECIALKTKCSITMFQQALTEEQILKRDPSIRNQFASHNRTDLAPAGAPPQLSRGRLINANHVPAQNPVRKTSKARGKQKEIDNDGGPTYPLFRNPSAPPTLVGGASYPQMYPPSAPSFVDHAPWQGSGRPMTPIQTPVPNEEFLSLVSRVLSIENRLELILGRIMVIELAVRSILGASGPVTLGRQQQDLADNYVAPPALVKVEGQDGEVDSFAWPLGPLPWLLRFNRQDVVGFDGTSGGNEIDDSSVQDGDDQSHGQSDVSQGPSNRPNTRAKRAPATPKAKEGSKRGRKH